MFWIVVGVAAVLFLVWMWRIDRRDNGPSRLGWGGKRSYRVNNHGLLSDSGGGMNANDQLANDAFATTGRAIGGHTAARPSPLDEQQPTRRFWQRGRARSSEDR